VAAGMVMMSSEQKSHSMLRRTKVLAVCANSIQSKPWL
jgi:hypothetical protein